MSKSEGDVFRLKDGRKLGYIEYGDPKGKPVFFFKVYLWYGAKDKCVSLNMARYYKSQIPNSELFIDPEGVHLSRYNFEDRILKTLTN